MGVNAIVIVKNANHLMPSEFADGLRADPWGRRVWNCLPDEPDEPDAWTAFTWKKEEYFSWRYTPRVAHLDLYNDDPEDNPDDPDPDNPVQLTFFKAMLAVERIAGGPVYVGNDVINRHMPRYAEKYEAGYEKYQTPDDEEDEDFYLPGELDGLIPNWRMAELYPVTKPYMVY
ncbi:MAG: hypothetical protein GY862_01880 [Gammaproteobacteria bacterium]|nr:hypothetical protein [Gammaproteobacteria bacterium]